MMRKYQWAALLALFGCFQVCGAAETKALSEPGTFVIQASTPKIKAGLVNWHGDYKKALKAADASGKPVFLFQLVGNLDESLC